MSNIFDRMISQAQVPTADDEFAEAPAPSLGPTEETPIDGHSLDGTPRTAADVKKITQELLKHGYLEEADNQDLFRKAIINEALVGIALEPLDLVMRLDAHRGVAFLTVAHAARCESEGDAAWVHPLVRRQRLTLEQSLLVAILRQAFIVHEQESGVGQSAAKIAVDELLPQLLIYFGDSGSDSRNEIRLLNLLEQLKPHGIVSEADKQQEVVIRPLIAHLANPDSLTALLNALKLQSPAAEVAEKNNPC